MKYRSLKNVVRKSSLERKCGLLFFIALSLVVVGTFWTVEYIAENLVKDAAIRKGRSLVDSALLRLHFEAWVNEPENPGLEQLAIELARDLQTQAYDFKILALDGTTPGELPKDQSEREILQGLKAEFQKQIESNSFEVKRSSETVENLQDITNQQLLIGSDIAPQPSDKKSSIDILPVSRFVQVAEDEQIHYYQPVYWKASCIRCHEGFEGFDGFSTADAALLFDDGAYPFRVVKVIIDDRETQQAIAWNRALVWAIGIVTVFFAMILIYVIVRLIVVRPLKHLRDVSEEISLGNTELRAEINTNDEFEELANAFNRMLHHLTDAQAELRQVNTDLDAKVDQLAQLNMRLYEMNRLKSDFLANMSHELRTPLNSIIGFSEVLEGIDSLNDKQKRFAKNIKKSGRLLLDLINDILDLAKIEAGKMDIRAAEFRVESIVHAQCDMVRPLADEKNIDLKVEVARNTTSMYQDQNKIQQILMNLLSNAIKFTPEGGRIEVEARRVRGGMLKLTVTDTGVGIAEEDREIIFEKFRQSSTTSGDGNLTREYSGTGLGLSIVKELCKLLGGEISFESELGKGTTFTVLIPWTLSSIKSPDDSVNSQLDEMTKSHRYEIQSAHDKPQPKITAGAPT